jgi:hypothetical protein
VVTTRTIQRTIPEPDQNRGADPYYGVACAVCRTFIRILRDPSGGRRRPTTRFGSVIVACPQCTQRGVYGFKALMSQRGHQKLNVGAAWTNAELDG